MNTSPESLESFEYTPEIPEDSIHEQLDELKKDVEEEMGPEVEDMTVEELDAAVHDVEEGTMEFLEEQMKSDNPETAARAKFQHKVLKDTDEFLEGMKPLIESEQFDKAQNITQAFLEKQLEKMDAMDIDSEYVDNAIEQLRQYIESHGDMMEQRLIVGREGWALTSTGLDILPWIGGSKMILEGVAGKDLVGKKMSGGQRLLHTAEGAVWLVVDVAATAAGAVSLGSGMVVVEGAKLGVKAARGAKFLKRGAAVLRVASKGPKARRAAKAMFSAGHFVAKHPRAAEATAKIVAKGANIRTPDKLEVGIKAAEYVVARQTHSKILEEIKAERAELAAALKEAFEAPKLDEAA